MVDESRLLRRCIRGEKAAWDEFVRRYGRLIYYVAGETSKRHGLVAGQSDLDDIFSDVTHALIKNRCSLLRKFDDRYSFVNWLGMITKARCIDYYRKKGHLRLGGVSTTDPDDPKEPLPIEDIKADLPQDQMDRRETIQLVDEVLSGMPARDRIILKLFYFEQKKYREIARVMKMSVGVVASNIYRAKAKLQKKLEDAGVTGFRPR